MFPLASFKPGQALTISPPTYHSFRTEPDYQVGDAHRQVVVSFVQGFLRHAILPERQDQPMFENYLFSLWLITSITRERSAASDENASAVIRFPQEHGTGAQVPITMCRFARRATLPRYALPSKIFPCLAFGATSTRINLSRRSLLTATTIAQQVQLHFASLSITTGSPTAAENLLRWKVTPLKVRN